MTVISALLLWLIKSYFDIWNSASRASLTKLKESISCSNGPRQCVDGIQCEGYVGEYRLLSGVQQSDGLREETVLRSAGSGPDAAVPSN